jgi:hypothetical protein
MSGGVAIHLWSLETQALRQTGPLLVPLSELTAGLESESFEPSGIEVHPLSGHWYLVAARQSALAEVTREGRVVAVRRLNDDRHRHVEGLTFDAAGNLLLGEEGKGRRARISRYAAPPTR